MYKSINFKRWNNITGWLVFSISFIIYLMTLEPTVSFWDCGEFLSCAVNLEVSHPPGAPFYILLARLAAMVYPSNPALMINGLSALASAFTVLFLFWTITWFGRKLIGEKSLNARMLIILISGATGALSFAFTDSFWFSAVEAEVYAFSSLLTALVFWCILKWEEESAERSERWLLLIAYLFGLSVGVHLLNLLVIPAIVLVYYFKKQPYSKLNVLKALGVSFALLLFFLVIILKGIPEFLSLSELFSVNSLGLPFNTGFITGTIVVFGCPVLLYFYLIKKRKYSLAHWTLCLILVLIGISSYAITVIRSYSNPPIDMTNPEDPFALKNYLGREQYDSRPLFFGESFASPMTGTKERFSYQRNNGRYTKYSLNPEIIYETDSQTLFPRMASTQSGHPEAYRFWTDLHGKTVQSNGKTVRLPSLGDNIVFFLKYQLGHMYCRYFMWNFAGKQNDIQGRGDAVYGNWKSGINSIDRIRLGDQKMVPAWLQNNKGNNSYYLIPLLLGIAGLVYQFRKDRKNFIVSSTFFFMTGIAVVIYLNEVPVTPRERDYVYVGSFYIFALWIGLSVIALFDFLCSKTKHSLAVVLSTVTAFSAPVILLQQNFDDHDRSGRYAVLEYARNYLKSCEPNAILFTNADNDTYPLWYAQEVEGIRRDVRLILAPYLSADWYVNQMRQPIYDQEGLKMKIGQEKYLGGKRSFLPFYERIDSAVELKSVIEFAGSDDDRAMLTLENNERVNYFPARKLFISPPERNSGDSVMIHLKNNFVRMDELVLLDILASNNWKRPVYFTSEQVPESLGFEQNLQLDGYAFKLVPSQKAGGLIDTKTQYRKLMREFSFQSIAKPKVYLDNTHVFTIKSVGLRDKFTGLAEKLFEEGDTKKATEVLDYVVGLLPCDKVPFDHTMGRMVRLYFLTGNEQKGKALFKKVKDFCTSNLNYLVSLKKERINISQYDINLNMYLLQSLAEITEEFKLIEYSQEIRETWELSMKELG